MNNQETKTQTVDLDIKALVAEAKSKTPQEAAQQPTAEDVLSKLGVKAEEVKTPETDEEKVKAEQEAAKAKEKAEKAEAKKADELRKLMDNEWKNRLSVLIEDGLIEDVSITINEGTEEEKEVYLSELEDLDADTYKSIVGNYREAKEKELKEKYISVEGLDETTKKLVELKKQGGDITQLIQEEVQVIDTLYKIRENLDNENEQVRVVYHELKGKGLSEKVIKAQIEELAENFQLEDYSKGIINNEIKLYEQSLEDKQKEQLKKIDQEKEEQKQITKELSNKFKEFGIDDNLRKLLLQNTTVRDEHGLTNTDKLYFDSIKDPEKHAKVAFLLNNLEGFEEFIVGKKVVEEKKKTVKSMFSINTSNVKKTVKVDDKTEGLINKLKM